MVKSEVGHTGCVCVCMCVYATEMFCVLTCLYKVNFQGSRFVFFLEAAEFYLVFQMIDFNCSTVLLRC